MNDWELLARYAREGSQEAFSALVSRHMNLVYSAARRQVRSPEIAEEVVQSVFLELARHAARLNPSSPMASWLHVVTRHAAIKVPNGPSFARHATFADIANAHYLDFGEMLAPFSERFNAMPIKSR